jgi:hypothetical protein
MKEAIGRMKMCGSSQMSHERSSARQLWSTNSPGICGKCDYTWLQLEELGDTKGSFRLAVFKAVLTVLQL